MPPKPQLAFASLMALVTLQAIMLFSLFSRTAPHPPEAVAPFGIAPFLGASIAVAVVALTLRPCDTALARGLSVTAALAALVSFGPHKYLDAAFPLIWPSVVTGQMAAIGVIVAVGTPQRREKRDVQTASA